MEKYYCVIKQNDSLEFIEDTKKPRDKALLRFGAEVVLEDTVLEDGFGRQFWSTVWKNRL